MEGEIGCAGTLHTFIVIATLRRPEPSTCGRTMSRCRIGPSFLNLTKDDANDSPQRQWLSANI